MRKTDLLVEDVETGQRHALPLARGGLDGCESVTCTRVDGHCVGWHCAYCYEPCSQQGHMECVEAEWGPLADN